jgi:hypothetical protein
MKPFFARLAGLNRRTQTLLAAAGALLVIVVIAGAVLALDPLLLARLARALPGTTINGCEIKPGAQCPNADLSKATLAGAELGGANLESADLTFADLTGANLTGANLSGADLSYVIVCDTFMENGTRVFKNCQGANLAGRDLTGADMTGADLSDATLTNATLTGVNFSGLDMTGVILDGAVYCDTTLPDGQFNDTNCPIVNVKMWQPCYISIQRCTEPELEPDCAACVTSLYNDGICDAFWDLRNVRILIFQQCPH